MSSPATSDEDPIFAYFASYPDFDYDSTRPPGKEFRRMCRVLRLLPQSDEKKQAREEFNNAIASKFNKRFGSDVNSLAAWQALCVRIQIDPVPDTLTECQEIVTNTHVNLVDLVDETEVSVQKFVSVEALKRYSVENHKIFPKDNAYAGDLLRYLLREFFNRYRGHHDRGRARRRRARRAHS